MTLQWRRQNLLSMKMLIFLLIPALKWKKLKPTSKLKSYLMKFLGLYFIFILFYYLYFKLLIYIYFYMLNGLVDVVLRNAGENTSSYLNFTLEGTYCCMSYISDVIPLMAAPRELSNHLMD